MKKIYYDLYNKLKISPYSPILGVVRSVIAFSLLLTLTLNSSNTLFKPISQETDIINCNYKEFTAFCSMNHDTYFDINITKYVVIICLIMIIIGYLPQLMGILHFYIAYSVQNTMSIVDGGDQVAMVMTFWLMLISLFDNRINHWHKKSNGWENNKVIGWGLITALNVQISYLYLNSAVTKMKNKEWLDGSAVYYYLNDNLYGLPRPLYNLFDFALETPIVGLITWGTLILQLLIFASIFSSYRFKKIVFYLAIFMHEIFALFMGLVSFSIVMLAVLIFYFHIYDDKRKEGKYEKLS
ncbi:MULTISPECIES: sporulation-delaying protein SdpB family protein [unclassified Mammaliicoccus]|uniref:sporulation-delaying protein SdpB family protein n=2 Tax=Mammaliicoccus TaxID=2803850 RepID=UPI001EFB3BCD|nr:MULTISPECIES: sporulation-delaying protein SdpB family protein [unclassified Mammaliicoccus]